MTRRSCRFIIPVLIFFVSNSLTAYPLFFPARVDSIYTTYVDTPPVALVEDFNEDGYLDIASFDGFQGLVEIYLGKGDGEFEGMISVHARDGLRYVTAGDFNGDDHVDFAMVWTNYQESGLQVLLGDGAGSFQQSWTNEAADTTPRGLLIEDFDEDQIPDLVLALAKDGTSQEQIQVYPGKGDGTFNLPTVIERDLAVREMVTADFNNDGHEDIGTLDYTYPYDRTLSVYLGTGSGTFEEPLVQPSQYSYLLHAGRFNDDAYIDLATSGPNYKGLTIWIGDGSGSFQNGGNKFLSLGTVFSLEASYVDTDAYRDLLAVTTDFYYPDTVRPLYGDGTGAYTPGTGLPLIQSTSRAVARDFSGDGIPDIVSPSYSKTAVSTYYGLGNREFAIVESIPVGSGPVFIETADFNSDDHLDAVVCDRTEEAIHLMLGDGTGRLEPGGSFETGRFTKTLALGDFNEDGHTDVVVDALNQVLLFLGNGKGDFAGPRYHHVGSRPWFFSTADLNSDGHLDLVVACNTETDNVWVLFGNGRGVFPSHLVYEVEDKPIVSGVGDFNKDGHRDFVIGTGWSHWAGMESPYPYAVHLFLGDGQGNFTYRQTQVDSRGAWLIVGDVNADGHEDLVDVSTHADVWLGDGNANFEYHGDYRTMGNDKRGVYADLDGDGIRDIASVSQGQSHVSVLFGVDPGSASDSPAPVYFRVEELAYGVGDQPHCLASGDFNEDGDLDLISANPNSDDVTILLNNLPHDWDIACGRGPGAKPEVALFSSDLGNDIRRFDAFASTFSGGVYPARANLDGKGLNELIIGAGDGGGPHVRVFTSRSGPYRSPNTDRKVAFFAYEKGFRGGVRIAAGDLDGDGFDEIVTGPGPGMPPLVRVFDRDGRPVTEFLAFDSSFTGGLFVACGDVDGDSFDEIVVSEDRGSTPDVRVFDGDGTPSGVDIRAYKETFRGGVRVACGDLNGDGADEILTAPGRGGAPHIRTFRGNGSLYSVQFMAYRNTFKGGAFVAAYDLDKDGRAEIVTGAGNGGAPHVRIFSELGNPTGPGFLAFERTFRNGVRVAAGNWGN